MSETNEKRDPAIAIRCYADLDAREREAADAAVDRIFFAASSVQVFRDAAHRTAFRWLWLGRYLAEEPQHAFVAFDGTDVAGYLVGSLNDPAGRDAFRELDYFGIFAPLTAVYPAHLHINIDARYRSRSIGARLVERFEAHAAGLGSIGVHIVTGAGMRNVRFYERLGFSKVGEAPRNGGRVVMLAKPLASGR
ncbi:MAG: GNAT family N-acetyltransferase [Alphaproteobacteria bacterium]|nr:GNAT family N-acetyltransferase [Alphaproteobacteria bacterium]